MRTKQMSVQPVSVIDGLPARQSSSFLSTIFVYWWKRCWYCFQCCILGTYCCPTWRHIFGDGFIILWKWYASTVIWTPLQSSTAYHLVHGVKYSLVQSLCSRHHGAWAHSRVRFSFKSCTPSLKFITLDTERLLWWKRHDWMLSTCSTTFILSGLCTN